MLCEDIGYGDDGEMIGEEKEVEKKSSMSNDAIGRGVHDTTDKEIC